MDMELNARVKPEDKDLNPEDTQVPAVPHPTKALSDGSREDTPTRTYRNKWTVEQRLTLIMLADSYSNNWDDKISVFNHVHKLDLPRRRGLRRNVVVAQWHDMEKKFDAAAALRKLQATLSPYDISKLMSGAGLERKAREIGVQLYPRVFTDNSTRNKMSDKLDVLMRKRKRANSIADRRTDFLSESDNESQPNPHSQTIHGLPFLPKTPTKINGRQKNNGILTPPDSRERKKQHFIVDKRLAPIGFRAFTAQSQGKYSSVLGIRGTCNFLLPVSAQIWFLEVGVNSFEDVSPYSISFRIEDANSKSGIVPRSFNGATCSKSRQLNVHERGTSSCH